ncbi:MAG: NUDIX domain-containing protein [Chitinophagales bacterium]|nr:NUDIX domain-containing protein [Chitinophagales bacterium]
MPAQSAGILLYRLKNQRWQFFLIHMGGPFWSRKDEGAWSIPKGELQNDENALEAAKREFTEETSFKIGGNLIPLTPIKQSGGKTVAAFALEGDCDPNAIKSNTFELEWPPRSGRRQQFPEADRAEWFSYEEALLKVVKGQQNFLTELNFLLTKS